MSSVANNIHERSAALSFCPILYSLGIAFLCFFVAVSLFCLEIPTPTCRGPLEYSLKTQLYPQLARIRRLRLVGGVSSQHRSFILTNWPPRRYAHLMPRKLRIQYPGARCRLIQDDRRTAAFGQLQERK